MIVTLTDGFFTWDKGVDAPFSPHFSTGEFSCHCQNPSCVTQRISADTVAKLNQCREELGAPIKITSGFRCQAYQDALTASGYQTSHGTSRHVSPNDAVDIAPLDSALMHGLLAIVKNHFTGIGVATSFIHCDLRSEPKNWTYS